MTQIKWLIQTKYAYMTVRDYLLHVRIFSNRLLKQVKEAGEIRLNGEPVTVRKRLTAGDELMVCFPEEEVSPSLVPIQYPLHKLYEDDWLLIVQKNSGMAVLPNPNDADRVTLANAVLYDYQKRGLDNAFHIVTRLDRNTSGLVLIAKDRYTHHLLQQTEIERGYVAVVQGHMHQKQGVIDLPIGRKLPSIIERTVSEKGKRAITHYQVTEEKGDCSFVRIRLETGRTHQIRVHFSHIGHPLLGDDLYGGPVGKISRQALHCNMLRLKHPFTGQQLSFYSHFPEDLKRLGTHF